MVTIKMVSVGKRNRHHLQLGTAKEIELWGGLSSQA